MVIHKFRGKLYIELVSTMTLGLKEIASSADTSQDPLFREELNQKCMEYNKALQMICDILMYLDRTFIPRCIKASYPLWDAWLSNKENRNC